MRTALAFWKRLEINDYLEISLGSRLEKIEFLRKEDLERRITLFE